MKEEEIPRTPVGRPGFNDETPLRPEEATFVAAYLETFNLRQAAIEAGVNPRNAIAIGSQMVRRPQVQRALVEWRRGLAEKHGVSLDKVMREISLLAFANMDDYTMLLPDGKTRVIDFGKADREKMAAVSEIVVDEEMDKDGEAVAVRRIKLKLHPKLPALIDLANRLGLMPETSMPGNKPHETHLHVHMNGLEKPREGEDRSYRDGYGQLRKTIDVKVTDAVDEGLSGT